MEKEQLPLVSIVTPSFNAMPYVKDTIKSVQAQDYPMIEHIIIDGGSTDGTVDFLKAQENIIWISTPDRGQSHALNKGFRLAKGEIIGWLNADDTYQPDTVSVAVNFFFKNPNIDLIYSDLNIIDDLNNIVGITRSKPFDMLSLLEDNFIKQPTVFFKKEVYEKLGEVNENLHYTMDREFWLKGGIAGFNFHYLENQILANFRLIPGTKSFDNVPLFRKEWLEILEKYKSNFSQSEFPNIKTSQIINRTKAQYYWSMGNLCSEKHEKIKAINNYLRALIVHPKLLTNRGTWFILLSFFFGHIPDRLRKFKKIQNQMRR